MYPREITTTPMWIRHKLPLSPPLSPNDDEELQNQIRSQNVNLSDEIIEQCVRQEHARLDLKWCLDEFFGWNIRNPFLGQLVITNIFGLVHLAYIIDIMPTNVVVTRADMLGISVMIGFDDIYSAEDSPLYEKFLLNHHLLHSQHVLDYVANQKRTDDLIRSNHNVSFSKTLMEPLSENFQFEWPKGEETWFTHDELPQRNRFVTCKQQILLSTSTYNTVEHSIQETFSADDYVSLPLVQQQNQLELLLQQSLAKQDILLEQNKLLERVIARQKTIINKLVLTVKAIEKTRMSHKLTVSQELHLPTILVCQHTSHLTMNTVVDFQEQSMKQLQFQQTNQLIKRPLFSEACTQYVSNGIGNFYDKYSHSNAKTFSSKLTTKFSNKSFDSSFIQLVPVDIMLITFLFLSVVFGNFGLYLFFYNHRNIPYSVITLVYHGIHNFEWLRTLAVP